MLAARLVSVSKSSCVDPSCTAPSRAWLMMWIASRPDFCASVSVILRTPSRSASISTTSRLRPPSRALARMSSTRLWYSGVAVSTKTSSCVRRIGATCIEAIAGRLPGSTSARNSAPCSAGVANSVSCAAGLRSAESSSRPSSSCITGLRTKPRGGEARPGRATAFVTGAAWIFSSVVRRACSAANGEDRIGRFGAPRRSVALAFAGIPERIGARAGVASSGERASAAARAAAARERAVGADLPRLARGGDFPGMPGIRYPRSPARALLSFTHVVPAAQQDTGLVRTRTMRSNHLF